jgi:hypothetical protein
MGLRWRERLIRSDGGRWREGARGREREKDEARQGRIEKQ